MGRKGTLLEVGRFKRTIVYLIQRYFIDKSQAKIKFDLFDRDLAKALLTTSPQPMYVNIVAGLKIDAVLPEVYTTYLYEREGT